MCIYKTSAQNCVSKPKICWVRPMGMPQTDGHGSQDVGRKLFVRSLYRQGYTVNQIAWILKSSEYGPIRRTQLLDILRAVRFVDLGL